MEQVLKKEKQIQAKPIMKWAGGKTQMLGDIMPKIPQKYGKYIEPFIGGGALFFALSPDKAIIADSNPELINMYRQVADNVEAVISYLKKYKNTKEDFYEENELEYDIKSDYCRSYCHCRGNWSTGNDTCIRTV